MFFLGKQWFFIMLLQWTISNFNWLLIILLWGMSKIDKPTLVKTIIMKSNTHLNVIHPLKWDNKYVVMLYTYLLQPVHLHLHVYQFSCDIKQTHMYYAIVNLDLFHNIFYHITCVYCCCLEVTYICVTAVS